MFNLTQRVLAAGLFGAVALAASVEAQAACTRLAFSVNDYGKDGPTKDAKQLLDQYIAKSMAERGIKSYTVGKKDVSCSLFLDFVVFDEHTCRAEATVCWPGNKAALPVEAKAGEAPAQGKPSAPAAGKAKATQKTQGISTGAIAPATPVAAPAAAPASASPVPAVAPAAEPPKQQ